MNEIKKIGIIGSGKMGSDIFNFLSDFNFDLLWFTRDAEHKEVLRNMYNKKIRRQLKHGILNQEIFDFRNQYKITNRLNDLFDCDLIIESVIEEFDVKSTLFYELDKMVKPSCILASNSSSILPSELAEVVQRKNRLIGLHFFYPIAFKNVVEVIPSKFTDDLTLEKIKLLLDEIKRFYIVQFESDAFILNRLLLQIQVVAFGLLKEMKLGYKQFDNIVKQLIPEFGLFEMMDKVGHHTMYNAILNYSKMDDNKSKYERLLQELKSRNPVLGKTQSHFFYDNDIENVKIDRKSELEIINILTETAQKYLLTYSEGANMNIFNLKKGFDEYCGMVL